MARSTNGGHTLAALVGGALLAAACGARPAPPGPDVHGAYRLGNGEVLVVIPSSEKGTLRLYNTANGLSRRLYPVAGAGESAAGGRYQTGDGWSVKEPAVAFFQFRTAAGSEPRISWEERGKATIEGARVTVAAEPLEFESQGLRLAGRLYLPPGPGPHPAVVLHQGSERDSWKDLNSFGYHYAAYGVAAFCYDKRGVGASQGKFTMDFQKLAADMGAAVERLKRHPAIDPDRIGVGGYSQGGWIGPLAAAQRKDVRFVLVGWGLADSPLDEDREQTLQALRDLGHGEADLEKARRVVGAVHEVLRRNLDGGWDELAAVKKQYRGEPWMKHLDGGMAGAFIKWPGWVLRTFARERVLLHGLPWDYDPRPTLERVDVPVLWLLGAEDRQAPNKETIARVQAFRAKGKPFDLVVLPGMDHGGLVFKLEGGERVATGFHPDCARTQAEWLARAAGVAARSEGSGAGEAASR